ncbi:AraC family transcriptional regulator N-terminal domain-containing protein [Microvirga sp. G4-2]|uniref:AraC family transcriptional regulator N-terminal domain-containing protein n=1 Tax=Microvirga sp. G4-2 TaxID=3434467 RepID=UPI004043D5BE
MFRHDGAMNAEWSAIAVLANAIERHVDSAGDYQTALPALSFHRRDAPTEPVPCIYPLSLALAAQGDKHVMVGDKIIDYFPGQCLLTTIDLPVVSHVTRATTREPYLGLLLRLDPHSVAQTASEMKLLLSDVAATLGPVSVEWLDPGLLDALRRLIDLLDDPILLPRLAPLIQQEIIIRLLMGPHGPHLRQLVAEEPPRQQIARIVAWLKENFTKAVRVDELAARANMSPSTFRQHFRAVSGMSPLQFQKQLRLQEARQLMLNQNMDVGQAARLVGYQSASQFSREYGRVFGAPPQRDVWRLRSR